MTVGCQALSTNSMPLDEGVKESLLVDCIAKRFFNMKTIILL